MTVVLCIVHSTQNAHCLIESEIASQRNVKETFVDRNEIEVRAIAAQL